MAKISLRLDDVFLIALNDKTAAFLSVSQRKQRVFILSDLIQRPNNFSLCNSFQAAI